MSSTETSDTESVADTKMLQKRLKIIRKRVEELRKYKLKLEKQLQPIEFQNMTHKELVPASAEEVQKNFEEVEKDHIIKRLYFHKLAGVRPVEQENRDLVFEFNVFVKGHYTEPYYLRIRKVEAGKYIIVNYILPDSILVREMVDENGINDHQLLELMRTIQCCARAYHKRKEDISQAKVLLKDVKLIHSTDYRYVEFVIVFGTENQSLNVCVSLIYESHEDVPSTLNVICKEADRKTLSSIKEDCNIFLRGPLSETVQIFLIKQPSSEDSSDDI